MGPISLGIRKWEVGLGNSMGPAYHKGVPCPWGSLKIPLIQVWLANTGAVLKTLFFGNPHPLLEVAYGLDDKVYNYNTAPKINTTMQENKHLLEIHLQEAVFELSG